MALYDNYTEYQDQTLSEQEQFSLRDAAQRAADMVKNNPLLVQQNGQYFDPEINESVPDPVVGAHMMIAIDRAKAQFKGHPAMPEGGDVSTRFPGVDPVGKYSLIDMRFAQREAAVRAALESRAPQVQSYVKDLLDKRTSRKPADGPFSQRHFMMTQSARTHRELTRASKLCLDPDGRRMLHQQARETAVDLAVEQYDKLMQGIEYAAGVLTGPVPKEISDFYKDTLKTELDLNVVTAARNLDHVPAKIAVEFQNLDNKLLQHTFAQPENWGKSPADLEQAADQLTVNAVSGLLDPYAEASADRLIDPLFRNMEKDAPENFRDQGAMKQGFGIDIEFSRGDLISIDGVTIREKMQEDYKLTMLPQSEFAAFYKEHIREYTNQTVAAGLMAGKRVEVFVPDKRGQIPKEPTQITKEGYEPTPLKPERFNAWQRHFAKRGFYKNKVARKEQYERVMAARERMRAKAMSSEQARRQERLETMKSAVASNKAISTTRTPIKTMFFGKIMDQMLPRIQELALQAQANPDALRTFTTDESGRTTREYTNAAFDALNRIMTNDYDARGVFKSFVRCESVDTCVCMLAAQGHSIQDIMDPNKLQDQREAAAREFMEHGMKNDQDWVGRVVYAGHKAMYQQLVDMTQGVDLTSDSGMETLSYAEVLAHISFGVSQMLATEGCREGYLMAASEELSGRTGADLTADDLTRGSELGARLNNQIMGLSQTCSYMMKGIEGQIAMAEHIENCDATVLAEVATAKVIQDSLNPGSNLVEQCRSFLEVGSMITGTMISGSVAMATGDPLALTTIAKDLLSPENRAATARAAASGRLFDGLSGKVRDVPILSADGKEQINPSMDYADRLVRQEDGSIVKQRTDVPGLRTRPISAFAFGKPAPEPIDHDALKIQARLQQQAPQKKAPQKQPPQAGGLKR